MQDREVHMGSVSALGLAGFAVLAMVAAGIAGAEKQYAVMAFGLVLANMAVAGAATFVIGRWLRCLLERDRQAFQLGQDDAVRMLRQPRR